MAAIFKNIDSKSIAGLAGNVVACGGVWYCARCRSEKQATSDDEPKIPSVASPVDVFANDNGISTESDVIEDFEVENPPVVSPESEDSPEERLKRKLIEYLNKKEAEKEKVEDDNEESVDARTRAILFKLRTMDRFPLHVEGCISSDGSNRVYKASGEDYFEFAIKVHQNDKATKKEFKKLDEMEKLGLEGPLPVLYRGNILVTKWMDNYCKLASNEEKDHGSNRRKDFSREDWKAKKEANRIAKKTVSPILI